MQMSPSSPSPKTWIQVQLDYGLTPVQY